MSQTLTNIYDNVSFALYLHTEEMTRLQEQVSSGSRINRASDDPSDAHRILGLVSQQFSLKNYVDRITEASSTLELSSTVLEDIMSEIMDARTRLTQISNGIYGQSERDMVAAGIDGVLEHIVSLANTKHTNRYIFGGANTDLQPYVVERTNGQITAVNYQGSAENRMVEVAPGVMSNLLNVGESLFRYDDRGDPVFSGATGVKLGSGTSSVRGDVWLTVTHDGSNYKLSIDDGATWTTVPAGGDPNQAVVDSETGKILYVDSTEITNTGVEHVRVPGTYDIFNSLISIRDILSNDRGLPEGELEQLRIQCINTLDELDKLLAQAQVSVGSRIGYLEDLKDSLKNLRYNAEDETSRLQEADVAQLAMDLSRREVLYQMSLQVAARLMSVSLLDFIG